MSRSSWVVPVVFLGVIAPLFVFGLWWYFEADGSAERGNGNTATASPSDSAAWAAERLEADGRKPEPKEAPRPPPRATTSASASGAGNGAETVSGSDSPQRILETARDLVVGGDFEGARERLRRLADHQEFLRENRGTVENLKGSIRLRQGDPATAVSHFVRARAEDPRNATYSLNLAEALRTIGMVRLTEAALLDALELAPDAFLPNVRYRLFLIQTGRREQVIEEIRAVKEEDRNGMDVLAVAAALHANAGSYDKVARVLRRIRANTDEETFALLLSDPVFRGYREAAGNGREGK